MRSISKSLKKKIMFASLFLVFSTFQASAQDPFDDNVDDQNAPAAPIDGLIVVGLIAGSVYGIKKIRKSKD